jgi:hypothetical protein
VGGRLAATTAQMSRRSGGVVQLDISFGAASVVRFSLRGMKVYGVCQL